MGAEEYLERARAELREANILEALAILEDGHRLFRGSPDIQELMSEVRAGVGHLESRDAYKVLYDVTQREQRPGFLALVGRKARTWTGKRTRKLLRTFPENARYQCVEKDILERGFKRILDIGTHIGEFAICLGATNPSLSVVGIDIAQINIDKANELNRFMNVSFQQGFAEEAHRLFAQESFDCVMLFEILEHVINVEEVLSSVLQVLREDGMVAITVPQGRPRDFFTIPGAQEHVRHFSDKLIREHFGDRREFRQRKVLPTKSDHVEDLWSYITFLK